MSYLFYSNATELRVSDYGHETGKRFGQHFTCERITPYTLPIPKGPRYDIVSKSATSAYAEFDYRNLIGKLVMRGNFSSKFHPARKNLLRFDSRSPASRFMCLSCLKQRDCLRLRLHLAGCPVYMRAACML
ncbi:hypothetical protein NXS19_007650 [Fusarium pseudograminearum]|nr:hypothetical protein NXS19_007650 [Fusarium pseudograminearum]